MKRIIVGIDIGGTSTKFGLVDKDGNVLYKDHIPTSGHSTFDGYIEVLADAVQKAVQDTGEAFEVLGIGIGAPNANPHRGTIEHAVNLRWKGILPLSDSIKARFDVPVVVTNDASAAAIGEMTFGGAKGMQDFVVITLGTGLGSSIVANAQPVYGKYGMAAEIGHTLVRADGRTCGCGKKGCLETYASATGIKRTVYQLLSERNEESKLRDIPFCDLTAKIITEHARQGDAIALAAFEYTARILGIHLANTVLHTGPEAIFISGGLSMAGDLLFHPTITHLEENLMPAFRGTVQVLPSQLQGQEAPIIGASSLVWNLLKNNG